MKRKSCEFQFVTNKTVASEQQSDYEYDENDNDFRTTATTTKLPLKKVRTKESKTKCIKSSPHKSSANGKFVLKQTRAICNRTTEKTKFKNTKTVIVGEVKVLNEVPVDSVNNICISGGTSNMVTDEILDSTAVKTKSRNTDKRKCSKNKSSKTALIPIQNKTKLCPANKLMVISISDESESEEFQLPTKQFTVFTSPANKIKDKIKEPQTKISKKVTSSKVQRSPVKSLINEETITVACKTKKGLPIKNKKKVRKTNEAKKNINEGTPKKVPKIHDGYCPFCQMPFSALGMQSPNWHSMECMDLPLVADTECELGIQCDSTIASHYRRYKHSTLATYRATLTDPNQSFSLESKTSTSATSYILSECDSVALDSASSNTVNGQFGVLSSDENDNSFPCTLTKCVEATGLETLVTKDESDLQNIDNLGDVFTEESDEDIFNVETPETPNFFSDKDKTNTSIPRPVIDLKLEIESNTGGFLHDKNFGSVDLTSDLGIDSSTSVRETQASSLKSFSFNSNLNPASLDKFGCSSSKVSTKQTSLFSFFQSNCKTSKEHDQFKGDNPISKLKKRLHLNAKPAVLNSTPSSSKGVKSDSWGSLRPSPTPVSAKKEESNIKKDTSIPTSNKDTGTRENSYGKRKLYCPFYKKIPETGLTVDAFRYGVIPGCKAYILTHFHYDHYCGLTKKFKETIYCSQITGNLVESKLKVEAQYIHRLPMNEPCMVEGVELILREANHCPGAVIIFMRLPSGRLILHTGDYRAHPSMEGYPELINNKINDLYLDTTYCNPDYAFPYQQDVIDFAIKIANKTMKINPNTCIVCGTYTIGKERVFKAIAKAINSKVCVKKDKKGIIDCLEDEELNKMVTLNPEEALVHVLPMKLLNFNSLSDYLRKNKQFSSILVFEPTGWTHNNKVISLDHVQPKYSRNGITHYGIPYSEHSSFLELKRFVQFLKPTRILPTVNNGNPASRRKMEDLFASWMKETEEPLICISKQSSLNEWMNQSQK
ncbi:DNA cross-link repair 1A protein isoform X1 [Patella vulgata]|uniref:DNA cross-link repair 1A protein isoform X1 n=1 Tax=Patella vulgata TaxID=6465 RepID=UPI00217FF9C6|nr:DNA cross-link repair 1A protein isoform X1 [Patella vulgata]